MRLPRTIGRYTLLELLGAGGSGVVYRGREEGDLGLRHDVAIRVLSQPDEWLGARDRFVDEAKVLSPVARESAELIGAWTPSAIPPAKTAASAIQKTCMEFSRKSGGFSDRKPDNHKPNPATRSNVSS